MTEPSYVDITTGCDGCPWWSETVRADCDCLHPDVGRLLVVYAEDGNPPEQCPLRKGPTLVVLRLEGEQ